MKQLSWRWALAIIQVVAAAAALLYAPTQYRHGPRHIGDDSGLVFYRKHYPPPVTRIAYAVSFPAYVAIIPVRFVPWWITARLQIYREEPLVLLETEDFAFICAVGVLWYWIGARIESFRRRREVVSRPPTISWVERSKTLRTAIVVLGFLFALGVGTLAMYCTLLTNADRPFRQIGPFGLIWSATLLCYCFWRFVELVKTGNFRLA